MSYSVKTVESDYDKWIVIAAFVVFLISTVLILDDSLIFRRKSKGIGQTIAQMAKVRNDVRRRAATDLAYFPVRDLDDLYLGDIIFTGAESGSQINFKSGNKIVLNPDSMIMIEGDKKNSSLNIQKGSIAATLGKNGGLSVVNGKEKTLLKGDNTALNLSKSVDGGLQVNVERGALLIASSKGDIRLDSNHFANLKQGADVTIVDQSLALISPLKNSVVWAKSDGTLAFKWEATKLDENFRLSISSEKDLSKILFKKVVKGVKTDVPINSLPFRTPLFWKVEGIGGKVVSKIQKLNLYQDDPPLLLAPPPNIKMKLHEVLKNPVILRWQSWNNEKHFHVQVSTDVSFNTLIYDNQADEPFFSIQPPAYGNYYWRVRVLNSLHTESPWSNPRLILVPPGLQLSPPQLPSRYIRYQIDES